MDISLLEARKGSKKQLLNAERNVLISKMVDCLSEGYMTTNALSKKLKVSRPTIDSYRPIVDELIAKTKIDRNVILNLEIRRCYLIIEMLMDDLKMAVTAKDRALFYNQISKHSARLAQITGLNIETHVSVDPTKLVIIRSNERKNKIIDQTD